jgi:hypothetical protein
MNIFSLTGNTIPEPCHFSACNKTCWALSNGLRKLRDTLESYERTLSLKPDHDYLLGSLLHARMNLCDCKDFDARAAELTQKISSSAKSTSGFAALSLTDSRAMQRQAAEVYSQDKHPPAAKPVNTFGLIGNEGILAESWHSNIRSCLIRDRQFSRRGFWLAGEDL